MKLHSTKQNVETNMTGASTFTIKASAKAFKVLSDGLYSDKIRAVIRELSCNALDSHTAAKKNDTPITVHLPNQFEPFFSVKDYGLGLSKDSVLKLYTTYFESTKADDNDQIGALGLGSKSPFSYTEAFTVISVFNGTKSTYSAFIGETGEPSILHLADIETDEPNGVEVQFAVKRDDFRTFVQKAQLVYRPFALKPEIVGDQCEHLSRGELTYEGEGWKFYVSSYYNREQLAVQGNIEYPLDKGTINPDNNKHTFVLAQNVDIEFALGELDIAASRESLGYDKITIRNIKTRLEQVYDELMASISERISNANTLWDAAVLAHDLKSNFMENNLISTGLTWQGVEVPKAFSLPRDVEVIGYSYNTRGYNPKVVRVKYQGEFDPSKNAKFYKNDIKNTNKGISRLRAHVLNEGIKTAVMVDDYTLSLIGSPEYTLVSSLPEYNTTGDRVKVAGKNFKRYTHYQNTSWQFNDMFYTLDESFSNIDDAEVVYYVPVSGKRPVSSRNIYILAEVAKYIGMINSIKILGVKESWIGTKGWKELENNINLVKFEDAVVEATSKLKGNYMINNIIVNSSVYNDSKNNLSQRTQYIIDMLNKHIDLVTEGPIKRTINDIKNQKIYALAPEMTDAVLSYFKNEVSVGVKVDDTETIILNTYPMFKIVDMWSVRGNDNLNTVLEYVNMVHKNLSTNTL